MDASAMLCDNLVHTNARVQILVSITLKELMFYIAIRMTRMLSCLDFLRCLVALVDKMGSQLADPPEGDHDYRSIAIATMPVRYSV